MNDATLDRFRKIAADMGCGQNHDWSIVIDQDGRTFIKAFGLTKKDAETGARYYKNGRAALTSEVYTPSR